MTTRRVASCLLIGALVAPVARAAVPEGACPVSSRQPTDPVWMQKLQRWLQATERHQPGTDDAEARAVAVWSATDLRGLHRDLLGLRDALAEALGRKASPGESPIATYGDYRFSVPLLQRLLGLGDEEARRGDLNRILLAGAVLHTDVVLAVPSEARPVLGVAVMLRLKDGQADGYEYPVSHQWAFARDLLDAIRPTPSGDQVVLAWYKATTSFLLAQMSLSDAATHLDRAAELFPSDPDVLFLAGCVRETLASPAFQAAARSLPPPPGRALALGSSRSYLSQAEGFFRKALEKNARLTDARLRLGRVLALEGRHAEAAEELRRAADSVGDSDTTYCACLLLGDEEQALGHHEAARGWYERAATLYPRAQSPLFALSHLALMMGDVHAAVRAADRIRALPADEDERADPWLTYQVAGGRNALTLWHNVLAALPQHGKRP